ncbi:hypothetical protein CVT24_009305 [Panaeolus cyanescens]|uniref:Uncharacterized protein n=1 Tax=Panaeolus cyanescens TaxID=181874 RepID=A0A409Y896_9AGAR|nr:hypothetical protein CVT24_009305 [Panaeolus cyanescens]
MDYRKLLALQVAASGPRVSTTDTPNANVEEPWADSNGIKVEEKVEMDGRDEGEKEFGSVNGSATLAQTLRLLDEDLQGVVYNLRLALQEAQEQLVRSEKTCQALYRENAALRQAFVALNLQQAPLQPVNAVHPHIPDASSEPTRRYRNAAFPVATHQLGGSSRQDWTPSPSTPSYLPPHPSILQRDATIPETHGSPAHLSVPVRNPQIETTLIEGFKRLNNAIEDAANNLSKSVVSVSLDDANITTPLSKDPERQAAFKVSSMRLGTFLAGTLANEAQKPRSTLDARLIRITITAFFTSLVAEWSGWCHATRATHSKFGNSDGKKCEEEPKSEASGSDYGESKRDIETALAEFANICVIATWTMNADWDAAFEKQLSSFLWDAAQLTPFLTCYRHEHPQHGDSTGQSDVPSVLEYHPLFILPSNRFHAEKMDDVYRYKAHEKGIRKVASCVGLGLSSGSKQDGTYQILVKPKIVLESMLFETLNPPQPMIQLKSRPAYAENRFARSRPKGGWSSNNGK